MTDDDRPDHAGVTRAGSSGPGCNANRLVQFVGVSKSFDGVTRVVRDLDLDIMRGEFLTLLGPSGSGKTTTLMMLAGFEAATAGEILLDGRPITRVPPHRRNIGVVFQNYALFPHMSVAENVAFGLKNVPKAEARAIALSALGRVGLTGHADDYPHRLSGGEQQRAALARAIAPRPGVLLMDEPFSGLDRRLRDSVREETLAVLNESGATSLIVTHDPEEAMRMADRIALMHEGRLVQVGTPEDLFLRPRTLFAARFFSDINELDAIVRSGLATAWLGEMSTSLPDGKAIIAVRPSSVRVNRRGPGRAGRVVSARFLGDVDQLEIAIDGTDARLRARVEAGHWQEGSDVNVSFDTRQALVFPLSEI
jgi:iron(III) transport system ATP-binding protein